MLVNCIAIICSDFVNDYKKWPQIGPLSAFTPLQYGIADLLSSGGVYLPTPGIEAGHVTSFGQWTISKHNAERIGKVLMNWGLPSVATFGSPVSTL